MKKGIDRTIYLIITIFGILLLINTASASRINPSRKYCEEMGYDYEINTTTNAGICVLPNNNSVIAWNFLKGKVGQNYSYCKREGYEIETVQSPEICSELGTDSCAVCVLPNGTQIEVTEAMHLQLTTNVCGDGSCQMGETYRNCPEDCQSGTRDGYCDKVEDNICDKDCVLQGISAKDPDCPYCGDGDCKGEESYENCKADCPSGFEDGYCDGVSDGRCDPDCNLKGDPDCTKQEVGRKGISFWKKIVKFFTSLFSL